MKSTQSHTVLMIFSHVQSCTYEKISCFFLLPHPFRIQAFPSLPLDAHDLARDLDISLRTASRIVDKKRKLKKHELIYLQMIHFGYVPEESFIRGKWFIRKGVLISYNHNLQIDINDANAYVVSIARRTARSKGAHQRT